MIPFQLNGQHVWCAMDGKCFSCRYFALTPAQNIHNYSTMARRQRHLLPTPLLSEQRRYCDVRRPCVCVHNCTPLAAKVTRCIQCSLDTELTVLHNCSVSWESFAGIPHKSISCRSSRMTSSPGQKYSAACRFSRHAMEFTSWHGKTHNCLFYTFISNSRLFELLFNFTIYKTIKSSCCKLTFMIIMSIMTQIFITNCLM